MPERWEGELGSHVSLQDTLSAYNQPCTASLALQGTIERHRCLANTGPMLLLNCQCRGQLHQQSVDLANLRLVVDIHQGSAECHSHSSQLVHIQTAPDVSE